MVIAEASMSFRSNISPPLPNTTRIKVFAPKVVVSATSHSHGITSSINHKTKSNRIQVCLKFQGMFCCCRTPIVHPTTVSNHIQSIVVPTTTTTISTTTTTTTTTPNSCFGPLKNHRIQIQALVDGMVGRRGCMCSVELI